MNGHGTGPRGANKRKGRDYGKDGARGGRGDAGVVSEERLVAERNSLLSERQNELDGVLDHHDTLVSDSSAPWSIVLTGRAASRVISVGAIQNYIAIRPNGKLVILVSVFYPHPVS